MRRDIRGRALRVPCVALDYLGLRDVGFVIPTTWPTPLRPARVQQQPFHGPRYVNSVLFLPDGRRPGGPVREHGSHALRKAPR